MSEAWIMQTPLALLAAESEAKSTSAAREWLVNLLRGWLAPLDAWLNTLPPWAGTACAVGLFVAAALWVLTLRHDFVFRGAPDHDRWRDLRLWAILALVPYVLIYLTF